MGIIKEPLDIDFEVDNRPLTKEEEKMISDFIRLRKEQQNQKYYDRCFIMFCNKV